MKKWLMLVCCLLLFSSACAENAADTPVAFPDLGWMLTLPAGYELMDTSDRLNDRLLLSVYHPQKKITVEVLLPYTDKNEEILLRKVRDKSNSFIAEENIQIGKNNFFAYHFADHPGWCFWLKMTDGFSGEIWVNDETIYDDVPPEAATILSSLRLLTAEEISSLLGN